MGAQAPPWALALGVVLVNHPSKRFFPLALRGPGEMLKFEMNTPLGASPGYVPDGAMGRDPWHCMYLK